MGFETGDGKERLPEEEDIYGVNDAEEREQFEALLGGPGYVPLEERLHRRRARMRLLAVLVILAFALVFAFLGLRSVFD